MHLRPARFADASFLGVRPKSSGHSSYVVEPHLGSLEWMEGTVPTPRGIVKVSVGKDHVEVGGCLDGTGTLVWNGQTRRIDPNEWIVLKGE